MATQTLRQTRASGDIQKSTFGTFAVGEEAFVPYSGETVVIESGYGIYLVGDDGVPGVNRPGYAVRDEDGDIFFVPAGNLIDLNGRPRHLAMVWPLKKAKRNSRKAVAHG